MTRAAQELIFDVTGQTLVYDAPSRPSSVTSVSVLPWDSGDDDTAESATTGSASIDSASVTVDANSGRAQPNPRKLNVNSTSGLAVGREYLLTGSNGETEWVELEEIATDDYVITRTPLQHDYVSGNTIKSTRIAISVDSTWIADENNIINTASPNPAYRARWVWVDGSGKTHADYTYIRLVRAQARHGVTASDMESVFPGWLRMLPQEHRGDAGARLLEEAMRRVGIDLHAADIPDEQVRNQEVLDEAVKRAAVVVLLRAKMRSGGDLVAETALADALEDYNGLINRLFRVEAKVPVATTSASAAHIVSGTGVWSR